MLIKPGTKVSLKDFDPADAGGYQSAADVRGPLQKQLEELCKLQNLLYAENRRSVLIILQGMDTSGKDGTIRHVIITSSVQFRDGKFANTRCFTLDVSG